MRLHQSQRGLEERGDRSPVSIDAIKALSVNGVTVTRAEMGHNHLRSDLNFSDYDRQLLDGRGYRGLTLWLWNVKGDAYMLRTGASYGGASKASSYEGIRQKEFDIPDTWSK
jgi:hypothetical protein